MYQEQRIFSINNDPLLRQDGDTRDFLFLLEGRISSSTLGGRFRIDWGRNITNKQLS